MVSAMKKIFNIFKSEMLNIFKDPGCVLIMVGGIFLYGLFYIIPFSTHILRDVPIGVIDFDNTSMSRELIRNFDSNEFIKVYSRPQNIELAKEEYYQDKIKAFVVIPKDFEKNLLRGGNSYISSYEDSAFLIIYKQVATGVITTANALGAKVEIASLMKKGISKQQAMTIKLPFEFVENPLFNPIGSYLNYLYPLVLILILQQTMLTGIGILGATIKERLNGYKIRNKEGEITDMKLDKISEFSDNPYEIVFGKSLAYTSLYLIYSLLYFLILPPLVVYNSTYNILPMCLILIPFLFSTAFLGQSLVYFYQERESALLLLIVTSVPMIFLPGFIWPKECIPSILLFFSKFIPSTSAIDGLIKINQMGATFSQVLKDFLLLLGLCLLYFFCAVQVIKKLTKIK